MPTKEAIAAIIGSYRVLLHYAATAKATKGRLYAVFGPDGQITDPSSHAIAIEAMRLIVAQEILDACVGDDRMA